MPVLPGEPSEQDATISVASGVDLALYSSQAAEVFTENGASEVTLRHSTEGDDGYLVLVIPTNTSEDAGNVIDFLRESELAAGLTETEIGVTGSNDTGRMSGTWYVSGNAAVVVWVSQPLSGDPNSLEQRLQSTVDLVQESFPEE